MLRCGVAILSAIFMSGLLNASDSIKVFSRSTISQDIWSHVFTECSDPLSLRLVSRFFRDTVSIQLRKPIELSWSAAKCLFEPDALIEQQEKAQFFISMARKNLIRTTSWWVLERCPEDSLVLFFDAVSKQKELKLELVDEYYHPVSNNGVFMVLLNHFLLNNSTLESFKLRRSLMRNQEVFFLCNALKLNNSLKRLEFQGNSVVEQNSISPFFGEPFMTRKSIKRLEGVGYSKKFKSIIIKAKKRSGETVQMFVFPHSKFNYILYKGAVNEARQDLGLEPLDFNA